jgi:hypothetical protein
MNTSPDIICQIDQALNRGVSHVSITYIGRSDKFVSIRPIPKHCDGYSLVEERAFETVLLYEPADLLWAIIVKMELERFDDVAELGSHYIVITTTDQWDALRMAVRIAGKEIHALEAAGELVSIAQIVVNIPRFSPPASRVEISNQASCDEADFQF